MSDLPDDDSSLAAAEAQSEVQEYLYARQQRRQLLPRAALIGLAAGIVAVLFREGLEGEAALLSRCHAALKGSPLGVLLAVAVGALGAALSVAVVRRWAPEAAGSGIPHLEAVLRRYRSLNGARVLPTKFLGGLLALGCGLVMGREGPTIQMGVAAAELLSRPMRLSERDRRTLLAAGAGAGLSAAFNAPLSGLIFVLEEIQRDFHPIVFASAFLAAAVADIVARLTASAGPVLSVPAYPIPPLASLPAFLLLGAVAGGLGVVFNRCLLGSLNLYAKVPPRRAIVVAGAVGGVIGLLGWFVPDARGVGHQLFEAALHGQLALLMIPAWFALRFLLTAVSYGTGAPGGVFAPLLVLGALLGLGVGEAGHLLAPELVPDPGACAVVGMAAYFTAIVRAPLTGVVLILEMTGSYDQMLPALVACFGAYAVAELLNERPLYEALLERDLEHAGGGERPPSGTRVMEFTVQPGSPFDGALVRDLGLPTGCILVHCQDEEEEWTPGGETRLRASMRITAVLSPHAAHAVDVLRAGCAPA